jgi:hypothetical protein
MNYETEMHFYRLEKGSSCSGGLLIQMLLPLASFRGVWRDCLTTPVIVVALCRATSTLRFKTRVQRTRNLRSDRNTRHASSPPRSSLPKAAGEARLIRSASIPVAPFIIPKANQRGWFPQDGRRGHRHGRVAGHLAFSRPEYLSMIDCHSNLLIHVRAEDVGSF